MSVEDILDIAREVVDFFRPIIEPILEFINIISGLYTLASFLEGLSPNLNNTFSLIIFLLSFFLMYAIEEEIYKWLRKLLGL